MTNPMRTGRLASILVLCLVVGLTACGSHSTKYGRDDLVPSLQKKMTTWAQKNAFSLGLFEPVRNTICVFQSVSDDVATYACGILAREPIGLGGDMARVRATATIDLDSGQMAWGMGSG